MKVPTYTRQVERVSGAITPRASAQVNSNVLAASSKVAAEVGQLLFDAGMEKLKIYNESQALQANRSMEIELRAISDDAINQDITVYTPAEVQKKMQDVYDKYANGLAINQSTGKSYLPTSAARTAFQVNGYETFNKYLSNYRSNTNKMLAKQAEINIVSRVGDEVKIVADPALDIRMPDGSLDQTMRLEALGNLLSVEEIQDQVLGINRRRGLLVYSATSGAMTAEKSTSLIEQTFEEIAIGTAIHYMGDDAFAEVASDFVDGDLEQRDPVLGAVLAELSPEQRLVLNKKVIEYANKNVTRLEDEEKARNEAMEEALDKQFYEMINIAGTNLPQAKALFEDLTANNYFKSTAAITGARKILGMVDENDSPTDDLDVIARLYDLASTKELSIEAVSRVATKLPKSYKKFYDLALTFADDGMRDGGQLISSAIGYDKYKDVKGIKDQANVLYQRAINEFTQWRTTAPDPGNPLSGGLGANYEVTIRKANEISERFGSSLKAEIQVQFNKDYNMIIDSINPVITNLGLSPLPTGTGNRKQEIMSWFQSLPSSARQNDDVLLAWDIFKKFENEDVR